MNRSSTEEKLTGDSADIIIYGGTSSGVAAAIQAARMNRSVILVEPTDRIGGLTTGGLGSTDIGNNRSIGGIAQEFYQRIKKYYGNSSCWKWQTPEEYEVAMRNYYDGKWGDEDMTWRFEPSAALAVFHEMLGETDVRVICGESLNRESGVEMENGKILRLTMKSGREFVAGIFIDATYEGDLMAAARVGYHVGREASPVYQEAYNGVRLTETHQLNDGIDPYVIKGQSESGLLPGIDSAELGSEGEGDRRIQAYCFRMCLTDHPENRIPFSKPENYNELDYELLFRNIEAGGTDVPIPGISDWGMSNILPFNSGLLPNHKTDSNNKSGFSTDFIGQNWRYPEADDLEREEIVQRHLDYQQGLMWTLANHPRIPDSIRKELICWGMCKDEFTKSKGWPDQLYIRESRRMLGEYIMTEANCLGLTTVEDPIGVASYAMDSHHVRRFVGKDGCVHNEGDVQVLNVNPYPISYRSIIPRHAECHNLLVPVCLSASHIAYGSIRMEPTFMILGQSAATAACIALEGGTSVQDVEYSMLKGKLLSDKQMLAV